jgi:hypothetical protein
MLIIELLGDHVPLIEVLLSVVVEPWQTLKTPVIAAGSVFTVNTDVVAQPVEVTV